MTITRHEDDNILGAGHHREGVLFGENYAGRKSPLPCALEDVNVLRPPLGASSQNTKEIKKAKCDV